MRNMKIKRLPEFDRDVKKLIKKYPTIEKDLENVVNVIFVYPFARPPFSYEINSLGLKTIVIKIKKIASASFNGRGGHSGFRIIYVWMPEMQEVILIEVYHKSIQALEDRKRIFHNFN
jgi:mRNA-degrading endonuclease RelE of RelBE toxin-antitoxin system